MLGSILNDRVRMDQIEGIDSAQARNLRDRQKGQQVHPDVPNMKLIPYPQGPYPILGASVDQHPGCRSYFLIQSLPALFTLGISPLLKKHCIVRSLCNELDGQPNALQLLLAELLVPQMQQQVALQNMVEQFFEALRVVPVKIRNHVAKGPYFSSP